MVCTDAPSGMRSVRSRALIAVLAWLAIFCAPSDCVAFEYETKEPDRDGTGRVYMGREISLVMGHLAAGWLERPERADTELPDRLVREMELAPDAVVADVGAGTGYFSFRLAEVVPEGEVVAVDIQPQMLQIMDRRIARFGIQNVRTVLGSSVDPRLADGSVDAVLLVDAYHEFSHPREMGEAIASALEPGGRLFLVEYRGEEPEIPIKPLHKMTVEQARREWEAVGLRWVEVRGFLPQQHFMVFQKPAEARDRSGAQSPGGSPSTARSNPTPGLP